MDEKIAKLFLPLIDKLYNTDPAGEPFRVPVDIQKYGCIDYYLYIKHPVDLSTIRKKLLSHQYQGDAWRFIADVQLMFSNAYLFNRKGTPVYEFTNKLSKIWSQELTPIMQRLNYCCGTLHKFGPQLLFCHGTTQDKYCQIPIGAKYKCYQDQYSFCIPCFNKVDSDEIDIQNLSCETQRNMFKLPEKPVKKSDFMDCANDVEQYEQFIQCSQCTRRIHQICDLHPASEEQLKECIQHDELEEQQKQTCTIPEEYQKYAQEGRVVDIPVPPHVFKKIPSPNRKFNTSDTSNTSKDTSGTILMSSIDEIATSIKQQTTTDNENIETSKQNDITNNDHITQQQHQLQSSSDKASKEITKSNDNLITQDERPPEQQNDKKTSKVEQEGKVIKVEPTFIQPSDQKNQHQSHIPPSLDDELLQFAKDVEDFTNSAPGSPNQDTKSTKIDSAKLDSNNQIRKNATTSNAKNSVDSIAARLSINKMSVETVPQDELDLKSNNDSAVRNRDKYVCNHCYRKKKIGFNLRCRKYSARRLPHTRMSRYIETKVNEHIREHSPTAGEVTIRVLTAYKDTVTVRPEMGEYVRRCREKDPSLQHPNAKDYPGEFNYLNRAIFAWQEIDGVDVCVFGMHVQEYGEDCPEPNRQVVYLSYLDSVHFFRPKQVRTAVYHEILLSYFKYVKKLGFRRVFIWVCPSRKGDDYIFYRHPTEQKMPTLKRLSDWYVNLLDKGIMAGIVEKHHNIFQYSKTQNWSFILSMPYLNGDYWPGEFERLLNIMIESQKAYEKKLEDRKDSEGHRTRSQQNISNVMGEFDNNSINNLNNHLSSVEVHPERNNLSSFSNLLEKQSPGNGKLFNNNLRNSFINSPYSVKKQTNGSNGSPSLCLTPDGGDYHSISTGMEYKNFDNIFSQSNSSKDLDQPLDLSKSSNNGSPEIYFLDGFANSLGPANRKRRKKSNSSMGYTKKRSRVSNQKSATQIPQSHQQYSRYSQFMSQSPSMLYESFDCLSGQQLSKSIQTRQKTSTQSKDSPGLDIIPTPEEELAKNLERSLKRQKDGFIVARLNDCDCSPHFESQRRKEETTFTCELMRGREPFLQLARLKNYEFSSLRRAKFSSLAMVKHLGETFKLDPICNECFSFDSSKRHLSCSECDDFYLCTSCYENTHHEHSMSIVASPSLPDIEDFLQQCSLASTSNSISSASSTISNKSFNESNLDAAPQQCSSPAPEEDLLEAAAAVSRTKSVNPTTMPLGCKRQKNQDFESDHPITRAEDEENARISLFNSEITKHALPNQQIQPPPSHSANSIRTIGSSPVEFDQVLVDNFIRQAQVSYDVDFDEMKSESKKLLAHYWTCPIKDTCHKCKFVVLSCSFMSILLRSTRMQLVTSCNPAEILPNTTNNNNTGGINLTTAHRFGYQSKDK